MIPKSISDAIAALESYAMWTEGYPHQQRAALERAIEDHVAEQVREAWRKPQPAEDPSEPGAWRKSRGVLAEQCPNEHFSLGHQLHLRCELPIGHVGLHAKTWGDGNSCRWLDGKEGGG